MIKKIIIPLVIISLMGCEGSDDTKITTIVKPRAKMVPIEATTPEGEVVEGMILETLIVDTDNMPIEYKVEDTTGGEFTLNTAIFINNQSVLTSWDKMELQGSTWTTPLIVGTIPLELGQQLNYSQILSVVRYTVDGGSSYISTSGDYTRKVKLHPDLKVIKVEFHEIMDISGNRSSIPASLGPQMFDGTLEYNNIGTPFEQIRHYELDEDNEHTQKNIFDADVIMNQCSIEDGRLNFRYVPPEEHGKPVIVVENGRLNTVDGDDYWQKLVKDPKHNLNPDHYHVFWVDEIQGNPAGFAHYKSNYAVIETGYTADYLRKIFVHEFGHSQNWGHHLVEGDCTGGHADNIMCPLGNGLTIWDTMCERYSNTDINSDDNSGTKNYNY